MPLRMLFRLLLRELLELLLLLESSELRLELELDGVDASRRARLLDRPSRSSWTRCARAFLCSTLADGGDATGRLFFPETKKQTTERA